MNADFDATALNAWLADHVCGFAGPFTITKFPGGQSNPTYRLAAASGDYVLRRKPFGQLLPSAHAVDREYRVIAALSATTVPVPRAFALCTDPAILGSEFYVMAHVPGRNLWNGALPDQPQAERRPLYFAMIDTLAALHNVDPETIGLSGFGKPGNYFGRQVDRWTRQYRASETETLEPMERLIAYLPASLPEQTRSGIVHGDYRLDNLIFAGETPRVAAILDWELATLGDPLADFSYLAMNWVLPADGRAGLAGLDLEALDLPTLDEAVARYCAATGRESLPAFDWYFAYNLFRLAGILQGVKKRALDGNASSVEALKMGERVPMLAQAAWRFAEQAGA